MVKHYGECSSCGDLFDLVQVEGENVCADCASLYEADKADGVAVEVEPQPIIMGVVIWGDLEIKDERTYTGIVFVGYTIKEIDARLDSLDQYELGRPEMLVHTERDTVEEALKAFKVVRYIKTKGEAVVSAPDNVVDVPKWLTIF